MRIYVTIVIMYFLFIIWTSFLTHSVSKKNVQKEIYNDKYRHTRDRLFGLCQCRNVDEGMKQT